MAYNAVPTKSPGDSWSAADTNTYLRDNFAAGIPGLMTAKGDIVAATGANAGARLAVGSSPAMQLEAMSATTTGLDWVSFTEATRIKYEASATTSLTSGSAVIVDFDTEVYDTSGGLVTTGAAWKFTNNTNGYYFVTAMITLASAAFDAGEYLEIGVYIDNSLYCVLGRYTATGAVTAPLSVSGAALVYCAASSYIDVRATQNSGGAINTSSDGDYCHVAIARLYSE